jgi:two-component system response regulator YesN
VYSAILVDDEKAIREGLRHIIDWQDCGFNIIGDASNADQAVGLIMKNLPDLVVTDIKMPGTDGLQMIKALKSSGYEGMFILVTGHADFKYAQTAIKYGVKSYLLKPIDERTLAGELYAIRSELNARGLPKQHITNAVISMSREKFLEQLVTGLLNGQEITDGCKVHQMNFPWKLYRVIILRFQSQNSCKDTIKILHSLATDFVEKNDYGIMFMNNREIVIIYDGSRELNKILFERFQRKISENLKIDLVVSIGNPVESLKDIAKSFNNAEILFEKRFIYGDKCIISSESIPEGSYEKSEVDTNELVNKLFMAIDCHSLSDIEDLLEKWVRVLIQNEQSEMEIKAGYVNVYVNLVDKLMNANPEIDGKIYRRQVFIEEIYFMPCLSELNVVFKTHLLKLSNEHANLRPDAVIKKVISYMERNYAENITVESISQALHYNKTYLGRKFRNDTGEFFNTYLDKLRIAKSKELLLRGYKVYQVAEMTGFHDIDLMNAKFKKYENQSPSAYKASNKRE